ncbi:MAG: YgiT-type zinc finger protein [FCB group bacterium]
MNKSCLFCGNKNLTNKNVQYIYKHDSKFMIVNDVPCLECDFCGEQYFDGKILERIENMFLEVNNNKKKVKSNILVPIENFTNILP